MSLTVGISLWTYFLVGGDEDEKLVVDSAILGDTLCVVLANNKCGRVKICHFTYSTECIENRLIELLQIIYIRPM